MSEPSQARKAAAAATNAAYELVVAAVRSETLQWAAKQVEEELMIHHRACSVVTVPLGTAGRPECNCYAAELAERIRKGENGE